VSHAWHWRLDRHQCSESSACIQLYQTRLHMQSATCHPRVCRGHCTGTKRSCRDPPGFWKEREMAVGRSAPPSRS
jgi:hypothetical protein